MRIGEEDRTGDRRRRWFLLAAIALGWSSWGQSGQGASSYPDTVGTEERQAADLSLEGSSSLPPVKSEDLNPQLVSTEGGRLSVSLQEARLLDVMDAIGRQGGIEIHLIGDAGEVRLTDSFVSLPLEEGLVRLLRGKNYGFVYSDAGSRRRISYVLVVPAYDYEGEGSSGAVEGVKRSVNEAENTDVNSVKASKQEPPSIPEAVRRLFGNDRLVEIMKAAANTEGERARVSPELNTIFEQALSFRGKSTTGQEDHLMADEIRNLLERAQQ